MVVEYTPVEEGYYRDFVPEYQMCKEAELSVDDLVSNTAHSLRSNILSTHDQTHFLLDNTIPKNDLLQILKKVEQDSMVLHETLPAKLIPFCELSVEECKGLHGEVGYEKFYKSTADKILYAELFQDVERFQDMAKWIKNNFDKFVVFRDSVDFCYDRDIYNQIENLKSQVFLNAGESHFGINIRPFIDFFDQTIAINDQPRYLGMHPMVYLGSDAPVFTEDETKSLIDRFYNSIKGMDKSNFRTSLAGEANHDRLKEISANFLEHTSDSNPEKLMELADIANTIFNNEWAFMYQGASNHVSVLLPRWAITLEEEFSNNWSGSCHPLLRRGINDTAYHEEAHYITYLRC